MMKRIEMNQIKVILLLSVFTLAGKVNACEHLELGTPKQSDLVDCRLGYAIGYDNSSRSAEWVAYKLDYVGDANIARTNDFMADPMLSPGNQTTPEDYNEPVYDMGHLANSESVGRSLPAMSESFYMSNMTPQLPRFNRGLYKGLENRERKWSKKRGTVVVYTGPLYEGRIKTIGNNVSVPSHFWKIIYDVNSQSAIAYLMDHKPLLTKDLDKYLSSIDEIERRSGLDFLSVLDDQLENKIEGNTQARQWR
jgi:endonuclease G